MPCELNFPAVLGGSPTAGPTVLAGQRAGHPAGMPMGHLALPLLRLLPPIALLAAPGSPRRENAARR